MTRLDQIYQQSMAEAANLPASLLSEPAEMPYAVFPMKLGALLFAPLHESIHIGQIGVLRRLLGKSPRSLNPLNFHGSEIAMDASESSSSNHKKCLMDSLLSEVLRRFIFAHKNIRQGILSWIGQDEPLSVAVASAAPLRLTPFSFCFTVGMGTGSPISCNQAHRNRV